MCKIENIDFVENCSVSYAVVILAITDGVVCIQGLKFPGLADY